MTAAGSAVSKFYHQVIEDVISNVRESFADEGIDDQVLSDLRMIWERKLEETKSVDHSTATKDADHPNQTATTTVTPSPAKRETAAQRKARQQQQQQNQQSSGANNSTVALPNQPPPMANDQPMSVQSTLRQNLILQNQQQQQQPQPPPAQQALPAAQQQLSLGQVMIDASGRMLGLSSGQKILLTSQAPGMLMSTAAATAAIALPTPQMPFIPGSLQANSSGVQFGASAAQNSSSNQAGAGRPNQQNNRIVQLDGPNDDSSDEDDDVSSAGDNDDDRDDNDDDENENDNDEANEEEEEPLNSEDDVSDEDPIELFDVENVVVCQYDKITRSRNKWKFHFKDGIMNLKGKDYVFQRAVGDAEW